MVATMKPSPHIEAAIAAWRSMATNGDRMFDPMFVSDTRIEAGPLIAVRKTAGWEARVDSESPAEWLATSAKWLASCLDYEECHRALGMIAERFPHLAERAGRFSTSLMSLRAIWNDGVAEEQRKARAR